MGDGCLPPETVDLLLAGRLDGVATGEAEAHIDGCARCRVLIGQLAKDSTYGRELASAQTRRSEPERSGSGPSRDSELASMETAVEGGNRAAKVATSDTVVDRKSRPSGQIPQKIDRYIIEKKLGSGGMGVVFLAEDGELKRQVVIKLLQADATEASLQDRTRLLREAQAMAKVSHPNVVPIYDVGVHDEQVFLAMEFIDGQDLAAWLEKPREVREVLDVFVAAGRGLAAAHRAGLVHRDFKPHNVMLGKTGEVKVTDFGLARAEVVTDEQPRNPDKRLPDRGVDLGAMTLLDSPLTITGAMVGTPAYMAPEQILASGVDARTDQFSFCVALYEGLYGERPFRGKTVAELFESTLDGKVPATVGRRVPTRVRAAVRRGLSIEPGDRFPSMDALLAAIAPRSANRYIVAGVLASVAIVSGVLVVTQRANRERGKLCTGAAAELATVWNPARAKALEAAFVGVDRELGASAYRVVAKTVDDFAKQWEHSHKDACEATRVRGEQTDQIMDRRMQCLRRRRIELDATLEVLATADRDLLANAENLVGGLASPTSCDNGDALAGAISDPIKRAEVETVQKGLAKVDALIAATRYELASKDLEKLVERAEKVGHAPVLAEVYLEAGDLAETREDLPVAQTWFDRALDVAEKGGVDPARAQAYIHMISIATQLGKLDDAERFGRYATATIERLGQDRELLARVDRSVAALQDARGQTDAATKTYKRAIERIVAVHGPASRMAAVFREDLATHYSNHNNWELAFAELGRARDAFVASMGPGNADAAVVTGLMAHVRWSQGQNDEALALGEQELAMLRAYFGEGHIMLAQSYDLYALKLQAAGRNDEALAMAKKSNALIRENVGEANPMYATSLGTLALLYANLGRPDDSFEAFDRSREIYTKAYGTEAHKDVVMSLNALGTVRRRQKRFDEAAAFYERSRAALAKFQTPDSQLMGDTLTRLGMTEAARGKPAAAVKVLEEALATRIRGDAGPSPSSWTKLELARALVATKGDRARAITLARESVAEAESIGDEAQRDEAKQWLAEQHVK